MMMRNPWTQLWLTPNRVHVACHLNIFLSFWPHCCIWVCCHSGFWQKIAFLAHFQHVAWVTKRKKEKKKKEILLYFKTKLKLLGLICSRVTLRTLCCVLLEPTQDLSHWSDVAVTNTGLRMGIFPEGLPPTPPHFLSLRFSLGRSFHTPLIRSELKAPCGRRLKKLDKNKLTLKQFGF